MYYNLLHNWQKPFTVELYHKINLSCLPALHHVITSPPVAVHTIAISGYVSPLAYLKNHAGCIQTSRNYLALAVTRSVMLWRTVHHVIPISWMFDNGQQITSHNGNEVWLRRPSIRNIIIRRVLRMMTLRIWVSAFLQFYLNCPLWVVGCVSYLLIAHLSLNRCTAKVCCKLARHWLTAAP